MASSAGRSASPADSAASSSIASSLSGSPEPPGAGNGIAHASAASLSSAKCVEAELDRLIDQVYHRALVSAQRELGKRPSSASSDEFEEYHSDGEADRSTDVAVTLDTVAAAVTIQRMARRWKASGKLGASSASSSRPVVAETEQLGRGQRRIIRSKHVVAQVEASDEGYAVLFPTVAPLVMPGKASGKQRGKQQRKSTGAGKPACPFPAEDGKPGGFAAAFAAESAMDAQVVQKIVKRTTDRDPEERGVRQDDIMAFSAFPGAGLDQYPMDAMRQVGCDVESDDEMDESGQTGVDDDDPGDTSHLPYYLRGMAPKEAKKPQPILSPRIMPDPDRPANALIAAKRRNSYLEIHLAETGNTRLTNAHRRRISNLQQPVASPRYQSQPQPYLRYQQHQPQWQAAATSHQQPHAPAYQPGQQHQHARRALTLQPPDLGWSRNQHDSDVDENEDDEFEPGYPYTYEHAMPAYADAHYSPASVHLASSSTETMAPSPREERLRAVLPYPPPGGISAAERRAGAQPVPSLGIVHRQGAGDPAMQQLVQPVAAALAEPVVPRGQWLDRARQVEAEQAKRDTQRQQRLVTQLESPRYQIAPNASPKKPAKPAGARPMPRQRIVRRKVV